MNEKLLATIPYAKGKSIDYYGDRVTFNGREVLYDSIAGYAYSLRSFSQSVYFVPVYNSKTVGLSFLTSDSKKPIDLVIKAEAAAAFTSQRQADVEIIFSEIVRVTDAILAKEVLGGLYGKVRSGELVNINGLIVGQDTIRRKGFFGEKELQQYGRTYTQNGEVIVEGADGRIFFSTPLGAINAPLLGSLLDVLFRY